ncbi:type I polyketide synthase [Streptantibioticus ferralitis]|uniref:Beta-ketoacyl synthase N-terminal-like domain-containing protein n=1 Tax=Streptantibioticus ferralitis TaxID=236510 RepID=A0ABT5ZBS0_9ACTN|nr:beta-ketoacyl synthase N-terminal-like domain-containing protein [Streptantibioticus ferralitis]MDF2261274.1 beta-ketoacyl synthase N-terminal-like domain-containing protein [Streptantibioticus ferralitis]
MTLRDDDLTRNLAATDVAVVGMAGRFPGAEDIDAYWRNLRDGVESITRLAEEELLAEGIERAEFERPEYVPAAPLLDGPDLFDARFFGFSAREAALLDPQQRLFLECAWHALEHAGIDPATVRSGGVFAGANMPAYLMSNLLGGRRIVLDSTVFELQIHNDKDYLATRTAHQLGFTGPALSVQTACSTSLVAVHEAAQSLHTGACDVALAGGVCVRVPHRVGYRYERGLIYSPDGHCRPFDAEAQGTVFGSGVGVVVLKRLTDAVADGDRVLAVLKGSAVNNDGSDKVSYTSPSVTGQERVVLQALRAGGVDARTVTAIEAHGTATPIGDPIEINALTRAHRHSTQDTGYCAIGSVKSNIGHLESAAGIASLIKAVLQLQHRELAPSLHFRTPNPRIDFGATPFRVNTERVAWEPGDVPRRIGVSSFGIGGTNAHVVLEEASAACTAPEPVATGPATDRPQLLLLSARTPQALEAATDRLARRFAGPDAPAVADAAYTLQTGRRPMRHRRAVLVPPDPARAASLLGGADPDRARQGNAGTGRPRTVFLFPGQGTQFPKMGHGLYTADPGFAADIDRSARLLHPDLGFDLREALYGTATDAERLTSTEVAQPALFTTEYALARLLLRWGVAPDDMVGHSVGEFTAACVAGVLPLEDALHLVALRGKLMREQPPGAMLSVEAAEETLVPLLPQAVSVAAVNAPALCVAAGPEEGVAALERALADAGVAARRLHTSHAFHSAMMDPVVGPLTEAVRGAALVPGERPFVSGVTGEAITPGQATDPAYWGSHARQPVRFADAVRTAASRGRTVLVEVGPGTALSTLSRAALADRRGISTVRTMRRPGEAGDDLETLLLGVGDLWLAGGEMRWHALHDGPRRRAALPGYPFQRERHWIGPGGGRSAGTAGSPAEAADVRPMAPEAKATPSAEERSTRPAGLRSGYAAPRDAAEKRIVALWEAILGFEGIGIHDDFFELGGHSLLGTQLVNRLQDELGVTVSLRKLLSHPTPAKLGAVVTLAMADPAAGAAESP